METKNQGKQADYYLVRAVYALGVVGQEAFVAESMSDAQDIMSDPSDGVAWQLSVVFTDGSEQVL